MKISPVVPSNHGAEPALLVLDLAAVDEVVHGQFANLTRFGAWNVDNLNDLGWDVAQRAVGAKFRSDQLDQVFI